MIETTFFMQLAVGAVMVCITFLIHAVALDRLMKLLETASATLHRRFHRQWKVPMLILTVLGVFGAHVVQIWLWAIFYLQADALQNLEEALYFSTSSFTTAGYGDVVLGKDWRLLGSFQAANGFLLFGWSTAFIFEVISKLYEMDTFKKR